MVIRVVGDHAQLLKLKELDKPLYRQFASLAQDYERTSLTQLNTACKLLRTVKNMERQRGRVLMLIRQLNEVLDLIHACLWQSIVLHRDWEQLHFE